MLRRPCLIAAFIVAASAVPALAQEPPISAPAASPPASATSLPPARPPATAETSVEVSTLAAPDAFTTPGRATGLPPTLWRGASVKTARTVLALLQTRTLSPAAAALARRVLATGAPGPQGAGTDPALVGSRASALLAQGDVKAAAAILSRAPGIDRSPELAHAAAETALLTGDDARACSVAEGLTSGRDEVYWLRLRTYCQAVAGHADQAQLTFDLAQTQARDPIFGRLMTAKLTGAGNPGAASLRNGLDYALSHGLGLDLAVAKASPEVAAALSGADPQEPLFDAAAASPEVALLVEPLMKGQAVHEVMVKALVEAAGGSDPKARARAQAAALLALGLSGPLDAEARGDFAALSTPEGRAPVGRDLALDAAADQKLMGEAALLALWTSAEAGPSGVAMGDRARIVRALHAVGLEVDARAFALEGLIALK
ncbi:hypothetical protein [Phenylobacterium sp.]|uniref:hypothetical protein n=1 Tax=Phenylobacterium sp. TaxID=1871053 RepID=UPI002C647B99|nr:hypothetical protein [Phenylobacterium sp.]HLZ74719.1 hypothetical protein [Phenylobacterium sp.]